MKIKHTNHRLAHTVCGEANAVIEHERDIYCADPVESLLSSTLHRRLSQKAATHWESGTPSVVNMAIPESPQDCRVPRLLGLPTHTSRV